MPASLKLGQGGVPATVEQGTEAKPEEAPYQPHGAALGLFRSRAREVLLAGPAGTGKSRACLEKLNLIAMQKPIRAAIVRKTRKSLTQSAMATFENKVLPRPNQVRFHEGDQEYRYPSGARIMVAGLDDPEKIGSTEFDIVYCLVGETQVSSPSAIERGYDRVYTGPLVTIRTALGHELTGTPNHPVLTDEGWVALGSLRKGQHVVSCLGAQGVPPSDPDVDDHPATIAEIVRTLALLPTSVTERIEGIRMDFHGDGTDREIDVVLAVGELEERVGAQFGQRALKDAGFRGDFVRPQLAHGRTFDESRVRGLATAVEFSHAFPERVHARSVALGLHPAQTRYVSCRSELHVPPTRAIPNVAQRLAFAGRTPSQSATDELSFESSVADTDRESDRAQSALAGQVTLDRIIDVSRSNESRGRHVYNLQTASGYYFANSIVTHNCQEATELEEDDWAMLLRGLRNGVLSYQQLIADCNPGPPDHWLKQRCNAGECELVESRHEDNPLLWQGGAGRRSGRRTLPRSTRCAGS